MRTLPSHYLTGLSDEDCWMLMRERAFGHEKVEEYPDLEAIGKQIAKRCSGVPLAAKALGGMLRFKREVKEWIYVKESEIWELPQEESRILPVLRLSYHNLPLALRQCFAYCAIFPKDTQIKKEELIFMWMAHGYISSRGGLQVEDVGNDICNELVLRSLLQYAPNRVTKKLDLIMHDLLHDLAQSIMKNKIPRTQVQMINVKSAHNNKIRQVSLRKNFSAFPTSNQSEMDMSFILKNFFRLRILDASKTKVNKLSSEIGNLKHLRHLNLSGTEIRSLPDSLCNLWNLHVLNLDGCKKLEALPKKMKYLINLRHIFLEDCVSLSEMPSKIGQLTSLRTLSLFVVGYNSGNGLEELQWLNLGGNLKIHHLDRVEDSMDAKKANLAEKENLRCLCLHWGTDHTYVPKYVEEDIYRDEKVLEALEPHPNLEILKICGFMGRCFPVWMSNSTLDKVVEIHIYGSMNCLHLPQLGKLPHLKSLSLTNLTLLEYIIDEESVQSGNPLISTQQFQSLKELHLRFLPNIKGLIKQHVMTSAGTFVEWLGSLYSKFLNNIKGSIEEQVMIRSAEAFQNLEQLLIEGCSSLTLPPLSTSLKKLKRLDCSSLTLASLSKVDLQNLTSLSITFEENSVETRITPETMQILTNLKTLGILNASELSLQQQELEHLHIMSCPELVELPDGIFKLLHCLKTVLLYDLPKMVSLPKALQHLSSSLQHLELNKLTQLSSLPDWLGSLTSLPSLCIRDCPKITSLPTGIRRMTNLRYLKVIGCPELERRCEREKGKDWHKIHHIPCLYIDEEF